MFCLSVSNNHFTFMADLELIMDLFSNNFIFIKVMGNRI